MCVYVGVCNAGGVNEDGESVDMASPDDDIPDNDEDYILDEESAIELDALCDKVHDCIGRMCNVSAAEHA